MGEKTDLMLRREHVSVSDYDHKDPEEIRDDIQKTRASISHTVDLLQERLDPDRLKGEAQDIVREATIGRLNSMADDMGRKAKRARYTIMETIKDNPVPSALVGLGLGWLLVEGLSQSSRSRYDEDYWEEERYYPVGEGVYDRGVYGYEVDPYEVGDEYRTRSRVRESFDRTRERGEEALDQARDRAQEVGRQAREQATRLGQQAREQVQNIGEQAENLGNQVREQAEYLGEETRQRMDYMSNQARRQARRARGQFETLLEENPLAVGAAAMALGVALGLSVPETHYEDEYFGPVRDDLLDKAQNKAEEVMEKVEHVAGEALDSANKTIQEESGRSPGQLAMEAARNAAQTVKQEAERQMGSSSSGSTKPGSSSL